VYAPRYRAEWLAKITEAGVCRYAEIYYQQFDVLAALRQEARRELLAESRKHPAMRSGEYRFVGGQLKRSKKAVTIRGLNKNHNHDLKNIFKGAATRAAATAGPLQNFYEARIANGMKPPMARLTLARKIAAITVLVWKKGVRFDAEQLKKQAA
jgi:hypothetical protein